MPLLKELTPKPFQSTLPARGATRAASQSQQPPADFNPRSPHGERHDGRRRTSAAAKDFNPRSPHGERPRAASQSQQPPAISIHAPRTGSDDTPRRRPPPADYFNPRSPHGERLSRFVYPHRQCQFQSTLPARGATCMLSFSVAASPFQSTLPARGATTVIGLLCLLACISIHAPRTGSDIRRG